MIKRISLVWKHPQLSDAEFRGYGSASTSTTRAGFRACGNTSSIRAGCGRRRAVRHRDLAVRLRAALETAFSDPRLKEDLRRTREQFAQRVQVMIVDEHIVIPRADRNNNDDR